MNPVMTVMVRLIFRVKFYTFSFPDRDLQKKPRRLF